MKPYFVRPPKIVQWMFPKRIWSISNSENRVYLTFDDGPIPEVTPWVLDILKKYDAKATFFCIGDNINKHPGLFNRIISEGHAIGNHTYNHLRGTQTKTSVYIENVVKAEEVIKRSEVGSRKSEVEGQEARNLNLTSNIVNRKSLFRPPYGKITSAQARILQKKGYKIVMWDVLSADFDSNTSEEECLQNVIKNIHPGSIVVFHDSLKAEKNLRYTLPKVLNFLSEKKFHLIAIE